MKKPKKYKPGSPGFLRKEVDITLTQLKQDIYNGDKSRSWYRKVGLLGGKHERKA
jgi:hypothetical protein